MDVVACDIREAGAPGSQVQDQHQLIISDTLVTEPNHTKNIMNGGIPISVFKKLAK